MEAPVNPQDFFNLLQSGGNVATVAIVWVAYKVKTVLEGYFKSVQDMLKASTEAQARLAKSQEEMEATLERIELQLSKSRAG